MKMKIIIIYTLVVCSLTLVSGSLAKEKDPFDDSLLEEDFVEEYPLDVRPRKLRAFKFLSWDAFTQLKDETLVACQIDGFLKIYSSKILKGPNKGKLAYKYLLYRSLEDLKYKRLSSAIIISEYTVKPLSNSQGVVNPLLLNNRYCIVSGILRREIGTATRLGQTIGVGFLDVAKEK